MAARKIPTQEHEGLGAVKGVPRALWTGSLGFGLLQIPVSLHTATAPSEQRFHQLDERTHEPIGYRRVNKATGEEIDWEHIARGYEIAKGEYVIITDEDLESVDMTATQTIDIIDFVDRHAVEPVYYEKPYYLAPLKHAERAYALFCEALERTKKVAIARVVIRTRQHLAMVYPNDKMLVLEILRWHHELRSPRGLEMTDDELGKLKLGERELEMAEELITKMSTEWAPARYRDEYRDAILAMAEEKAKTGKVTHVRATKLERETPTRASELIELLKRSLDASQPREGGAAPSPTKRRRRAA